MNLLTPQTHTLPLIPLREMVIFPGMVAPFMIGRPSSLKALEEALETPDRWIFLSSQKDANVDDPTPKDIHNYGVIAQIVQHFEQPNGNVRVLVQGIHRASITKFQELEPRYLVEVNVHFMHGELTPEVRKFMDLLVKQFRRYGKFTNQVAIEHFSDTLPREDVNAFADGIAAHIKISTAEKQSLLETVNPYERLQRLQDFLEMEIEKIQIDRRINQKVRKQMEKAQKEYYLNEKIKAIHDELGLQEDHRAEIQELKDKIETLGMPEPVKEKALHEIKRLEAMQPMSAEATVSRTYIDWLVGVPWESSTKEIRNIERAEKILNEDHYGLEKVKDRILEFLAVRQLKKDTQGTILCFVGPPGVGKSSLAKSIARATGRNFIRLSLGGVRDEAEIRGHRRTYIGALPGQIIQMMRRAESVNPVFLLDEVDKLSADFRGDPSAALMEVLDPEQNNAFRDHYLDVDYDLSRVFFIATANLIHPIPPALRDRMEIIHISGYTDREKIEIARNHLIPKQVKNHGLTTRKIDFTESAIQEIIEHYTREAGVRNLEREIASICRKVARKIISRKSKAPLDLEGDDIRDLLGKPRFRRQKREKESAEIGVAMGLAWTEVGGDILATEVTKMKGKDKLLLTGQLGDVMKESAQAALSFVRANSDLLGIDPDFHEKFDIHIHVPEGAIPKDGPSAGITMATALVSLLTGIPVRMDLAMTGEITLRGKVLPVGGIKDKVLAGFRAGINTIILPRENEKDLEDIPEDIHDTMDFVLVEHIYEVLRTALKGSIPSLAYPKDSPLIKSRGEELPH
ncbi:MAG TPA: endopeptidase La [Thermoanaerobaculia bacterium]|nr:endopeptidase La [Thermoanaerobaculia bacterium]HUM29058.1 endopeptidase La [Thermoanaerobaculia bacterium]HXK67386.1 endopeptidase La [Thermoanaerobaculia bacterium]